MDYSKGHNGQRHEHGKVRPPGRSRPSRRAMREELDSGVMGPGVSATKSQVIGGVAGTFTGLLLGGLIGLVLGLVFFYGDMAGVVITVIVGAVAGATALGVAGGFIYNRGRQERGDPDV